MSVRDSTDEFGRRAGKKRPAPDASPQHTSPNNSNNNDTYVQKWKYKVSDEEEEKKQKKEVSNAVKKEKERERRGRMTDSIEVLRSLIPQCKDKKINQSRVMELAVYHIQGLEQQIEDQAQLISEMRQQLQQYGASHIPSLPDNNLLTTKRQKTQHSHTDMNVEMNVATGNIPAVPPPSDPSPTPHPTLPMSVPNSATNTTMDANPPIMHSGPLPPSGPPPVENDEWARSSRDWQLGGPAYDEFLPITPGGFEVHEL